MKLSVNLVTWNGEKYIPFLFASLRTQTFKDWELLIIDNASTDNTVALIQKELVNFPVASKIIINQTNVGFAGGHNQAYSSTTSPYFAIINQDLFLNPDCFEKLVETLDHEVGVAAVAPRTMKWDFSENKFTNLVDSLGLKIFRSRRVVEQFTGQEWDKVSRDPTLALPFAKGRGNRPPALAKEGAGGGLAVFGVSGAIAAFRRSAINKVGFFDASFKSYKEDVDLAYRLQSAGWQSLVLTSAVAYHDRTVIGVGAQYIVPLKSDINAAKNKTTQADFVKYYSYRNHLAALYKNEYWQNFLLDLPWILWYEVKKFCYFLFFDFEVLRGISDLWRSRVDLRNQRQQIINLRKLTWREIRHWWK